MVDFTLVTSAVIIKACLLIPLSLILLSWQVWEARYKHKPSAMWEADIGSECGGWGVYLALRGFGFRV